MKERKKKLGIKNVLVRLNAMENHAIAQIFREYKIQQQQQRLYMTVATTSNCFVIFMHWQQLVLPASLGLAECAKSAVTVRQCVQNAMASHCITAPRDSTMQANISYQSNIINNQNKIYNLPYFLYSSKFILNANTRILLIWLWLRPLFCFIYVCMCRLPFDALGFC